MNIFPKLQWAGQELYQNYDDRHWYRDRVIHHVLGGFHQHVWPGYKQSIRVMEQDWDTLIVLDACRRDIFESVVNTDDTFDEYRTVRSLGSNTGEWVLRNFQDDSYQTEFGDTVYVTGNIRVSRNLPDPTFHQLDEVWKRDFDDNLDTVPPGPVVDRTLDSRKRHPNKRVVAHFLQPHQPFINSTADNSGYTADAKRVFGSETELTESNIWRDLAVGNVDVETVKRAYKRNLEIGWTEVARLVKSLPGRIVVTTDHGNMWGEPGFPVPIPVYGHPTQVRSSPLVDIPWGVIEATGDRPDMTTGPVQDAGSGGTTNTRDRDQLKALGYLA